MMKARKVYEFERSTTLKQAAGIGYVKQNIVDIEYWGDTEGILQPAVKVFFKNGVVMNFEYINYIKDSVVPGYYDYESDSTVANNNTKDRIGIAIYKNTNIIPAGSLTMKIEVQLDFRYNDEPDIVNFGKLLKIYSS